MPISFTDDDFHNLELVRRIVLKRLKADKEWHQFDYHWDERQQSQVCFTSNRIQARFVVLAGEVMWRLIIEGVITPGLNSSNPNLPFFRVTSYGEKVLETEHFGPHDPTNYLDRLKGRCQTVFDEVAFGYLEEALRCYTTNCNIAAVLLLGVTAESVFEKLCGVVSPALKDAKERTEFSRLGDHVKPRHRWLVKKYEGLPKSVRRSLPESLDVTLSSLYDLIRRQRNELGHPQEKPPALDREAAFVYFQLFPEYVLDVEAFAVHCQDNGL